MVFTLMVVAFAIAALLTRHFVHSTTILPILDTPNARSLHRYPIPITGGIAILIAITLATLIMIQFYLPPPAYGWELGISSLLIATISFIDDCHHLSAWSRLVVHFLAAYLLLWPGELELTILIIPGIEWQWPILCQIGISLLFIVWMTNLYNFMDGMDGFAGGMAMIGFGTLAIFGELAEQPTFMALNLIIASASSGFLLFNFPPARIFMGDTGASTLGFFAAALSLWGNREGIFPLWIAILLFSPFIVDASVTLLRRILTGEKFWLAHKSHYYQRLVELGWGHKRTVLLEYLLMIACSISALLALRSSIYVQWSLIGAWSLIYLLLMYWVSWLEKNN
jgi:UDP-N-acetylmuramyl pentapeptide phosphotransferase/UDP-N-acetylglucosamine-1-phosphate transferase